MREPSNDLERSIEAAFDYRGDVTVSFKNGEPVTGFLFNRDFDPHAKLGSGPFVEVFLPDGSRKRYLIADIASVEQTGVDHAKV